MILLSSFTQGMKEDAAFFLVGNIWWRCARDANNLEVPGL